MRLTAAVLCLLLLTPSPSAGVELSRGDFALVERQPPPEVLQLRQQLATLMERVRELEAQLKAACQPAAPAPAPVILSPPVYYYRR